MSRPVSLFFACCLVAACDKRTVDGPDAAPVPSPSAALAAAAASSVAGTPSAVPKPATAPVPLPKFAAFSADGKRFAYFVPFDAAGTEPFYVVRVDEGHPLGKRDAEGLGDADLRGVIAALKKEGFAAPRMPAPVDLALETDLTATPPKITLRRGSVRRDVDVGKRPPFDKSDVAEVWGVSPDGKTAAIHVGSRPRSQKAGPDGFHQVLLAAIP